MGQMFGFHRWINAWRTQDDSQSLTPLKPNPQTKKRDGERYKDKGQGSPAAAINIHKDSEKFTPRG